MKKFLAICPGCGSDDTTECRWSGELSGGDREYEGPWIECNDCGLQGPKAVWRHMAARRSDLQRALGLDGLAGREMDYLRAIEAFSEKMFRELKANDSEKGNFLDWKPTATGAKSELEHHFHKLVIALNNHKKHDITEFAADLANIALAIDLALGAK